MSFPTKYDIEDIHLTEKQKNTFEYISQTMDYHIAQLVRDKYRLKKCRNLYEGVRDKNEFRYLEETFGIETPMSVKMTPLIKTRIDVLIGLLLDEEFNHKVTVNDEGSFDKIEQEKKDERARQIKEAYTKQISKNAQRSNKGEEPQMDVVTEGFMKRLDRFIDEDFISSIEIAAQSLIKFFGQDSTIKLKQKLKLFLLDLLVTGEAYYRTHIPKLGADPIFEIVRPENLFTNLNTSEQFLSNGNSPNATKAVHRFYMTRDEILTRFGHMLSKTEKTRIFGEGRKVTHYNSIYSGRDLENLNERDRDSYQDSSSQYTYNTLDVYPVYHVEWLANNEVELPEEEKENYQMVDDITKSSETKDFHGKNAGDGVPNDKAYRLDRYEGYRIGDEVYVGLGKSRYVPRSEGQPYKTILSYNGVMYNVRNGRPYSVAYSLKDIQDSYDIVKFFRDNLIANSGVNGSRINLAAIPKVLGQNFMERLLKFMALRKQGVELIDPTEDGANLFQHYGDFRNSLDGNVVQSLKIVLEGLEQEADIVTGINRYMYQAAEQRDAVNNVKVGIKQTSLITKDMFELVNECHSQALIDLINRAKVTYKKGKRGTYLVGKRQVLFSIMPEDFCFTDFNIGIVNTSKENAKIAKLEALIPELVGKGSINDDVLIKMTMMDSTTEILALVEQSMAEKAAENDAVSHLSRQLEELKQQLDQVSKDYEQAKKQLEATNQAELDLKTRELDLKELEISSKVDIDKEKLSLETQVSREEIKKDRAIVALEREQLYAEGAKGNAKEVRNNI